MLKGREGKKEGKREEEKEGKGGRERKEGRKEGRTCSVAPSTGTLKVRPCFYFSSIAESV